MWKKDETPDRSPEPRAQAPRSQERAPSPGPAGDVATIGRSITIRGEVTGDEDLLIQGRVDGSVHLEQHAVTVGPDGTVKASIIARIVTVEGGVEGDLTAEEQIILRSSARVQGDIAAPRVVLEDGARFRGGVDMGDVAGPGTRSGRTASAQEPGRGAESGSASGSASGKSQPSGKASGESADGAGKAKGTPDTAGRK